MIKKRVGVAMSGGVDSSVAAAILKDQGYDVFGITMKHLYGEEEGDRPCCSLEDILDAKKLCSKLGIPHYTVNLKEKFKEEIIDKFVDGYKKGLTPNPCVRCNQKIKVKELLNYVKELGGEYLATGHYIKKDKDGIYISMDKHKDQSYFLSQVEKKDIDLLIFPLGDYKKEYVRELANKYGISSKNKLDSQGICFIKKSYKDFLSNHINSRDGNIKNSKGEILGKHNGTLNYTIGQRRGIGVSGEEAYYVTDVDHINNIVYIGLEGELFSKEVFCDNINLFISKEDIERGEIDVKARARDPLVKAMINIDENGAKITFLNNIKAATPGQVIAFYRDDKLLGSGIVKEFVK